MKNPLFVGKDSKYAFKTSSSSRQLIISFFFSVTVKLFLSYGRIIFYDKLNASSSTTTYDIGAEFNVEIGFGLGI